jgi:hypothetical protein
MPTEAFPVRPTFHLLPRPTFDLPRKRRNYAVCLVWLALATATQAQVCQNSGDIDASTRTSIEAAAKRYFDLSAKGDTTTLKQNSIPAVAANFSGIEGAVKEHQPAFAGAQAVVRPVFLLTADGTQPLARAEFLCGVFGPNGQTKDSAVFVLPNLPPGKYAVTILDVSGGKSPLTLTFVLQEIGSDWKLAGFFAADSQVAGHDAAWFLQRAHDFQAKSQKHNAWLYHREATALSVPIDFMSTRATDKLYEDAQSMQPSDVPANGSTVDLSSGGKAYHLTDIFPLPVGNDLDVVVKYQAADVSDTSHTFQENTAVIKALVAKYPELRDAFAGVVARAVDPSGRDYGTLLPMKDIK